MKGWRFSLRAILAWLLASIGAGAVFSCTLSALNIWADPADIATFGDTAVKIGAIGAMLFLMGGGVLLLLAIPIARTISLPRPVLEMTVLAAAYAAVTLGDIVSFTIRTPTGRLEAMDHPAAFIAAFIVPAASGAFMAWLYWSIANGKRAAVADA